MHFWGFKLLPLKSGQGLILVKHILCERSLQIPKKENHSRENVPSSTAPDGTDKGMLCTPAPQRDSFITVIYTCPKGVRSKLIWRFFNDSWDWNIPSVFNTEITSFILRWELFRISLCNFFFWKTTAFPLFFSPASVCKIAFRRMA